MSITRAKSAAIRLYRAFTGSDPELVGEVAKPKFPSVGIVIGPLIGVAYEATRDGISERYFHEFDPDSRPTLISSSDGGAIFILGGSYDFTEDGIVDRKPPLRR